MKQAMKRGWRAGLTGIVLLLALAGCTGASHGSNSAASYGRSAVSPGAGSTPAGGAAAAGAAPPVESRSVIRTAQLSVQVRDVAAQANRAEQIATAAGGSVDSDDRTSQQRPSATLVLRVPQDVLAATIDKLSALGREISRQTSTRDVTGQVADVSSRVASAQASIARLRTLFAAASKVSDIIAIESELAQRESDLESLQAQQRALAAQTAMATVTLELTGLAPVAAKHRGATGFLGGLQRGWEAFVAAAGAVATGIGAALPFLVLLALVGAAALVLRRRLRTAAPMPPPPPTPAE